MLSIKAVMLAVLLSFPLNGAASCNAQKGSNAGNSNQTGKAGAPAQGQPERPRSGDGSAPAQAASGELKILAQGQHSPVVNAFIVVARDAETYGELRKLVPNLPQQDENFFRSNLVVAAFLGERSSGGYSVQITREEKGFIQVSETRPPKDSMTIQVMTYPFTVVAVPAGHQEPLLLDAGASWGAMTWAYRVTNGEFVMSGGFAGLREKFGITGRVLVMREAKLVTLSLDLKSRDATKQRVLRDVVSGIVEPDGRVRVNQLGAGSFVDPPADALRLGGAITENGNKLSLTFESIPGQIADGFNGSGSLSAEAVLPTPRKNRASAGDAPR